MVAVRVGEGLPDAPRPCAASSSIASSFGPRASGPVPRSSYSSQYASIASPHASASQPDSASSSPSASTLSRAASSTQRNTALRTRTRKARAFAVTGLTWSAFSWASSAVWISGFASCSHSSSSEESTWRTISPSQAIRSSRSSVFRSSGMVWSSALYALARYRSTMPSVRASSTRR
ncbi:hypothetical protein STANM309S_01121 [Streptomyces tanashiensis]